MIKRVIDVVDWLPSHLTNLILRNHVMMQLTINSSFITPQTAQSQTDITVLSLVYLTILILVIQLIINNLKQYLVTNLTNLLSIPHFTNPLLMTLIVYLVYCH